MSRFSNLRRWLSGSYASLAKGEPAPRSIDEGVPAFRRAAGVGVYELTKSELDDHWDLFTSVPLVREPIRAFATEVVAPGLEVEAASAEAEDDLEKWLASNCILNGEVDKPFRLFVKAVIIQREVRGTAFVEKVRKEEDDGLYGFKGLPAHSINQYTYPGQAVLLGPDADVEDAYTNEDGETAAYVQFDDSLNRFTDRDPIPFTRDQLIKVTRDADFGEVSGNSRLDAVEDRINSLLTKLDANDEAIQSKAWKFWLFKMGVGDRGPWDPDDIEKFMKNHEAENFTPGMKQAVQGDIEIDTIEGEVAEGLAEFLDFDVDWIISAMPLPKYALGGFEENVNQFVSRSQEARIENQIQEARQEIEDEFTPVLREKAEELGHAAEDVKLKFKEEDFPRMDPTRPPASAEQDGDQARSMQDDEPQEEDNSVWTVDVATEELAPPRLVSVRAERRTLDRLAQDFLSSVRDGYLDRVETDYRELQTRTRDSRQQSFGRSFQSAANRELTQELRRHRLSKEANGPFRTVVDGVLDRLGDEPLNAEATFGFEERRLVKSFADDFERSVEDAAERMLSTIRVQAQTAFENGEDAEKVVRQAERQFSDSEVASRSQLIGHMAVQNAVGTATLREYERHPDVTGVRVVNTCDGSQTPLCAALAGCTGERPAVAIFSEGDIGLQLQSHVNEDHLFAGFDPLPASVPFHWGCTSELEPILDGEEEAVESAAADENGTVEEAEG